MGALGLAQKGLRRHGTCAPVTMEGSTARVRAMGNERTDSKGANVTANWNGRAVRPVMGCGAMGEGHDTAADGRTVGEGANK
jgi:hypothetical protein